MSSCGMPYPAIASTIFRWSAVGSCLCPFILRFSSPRAAQALGLAARKFFPPAHDDIAVDGVDLDTVAPPTGHLGCDQAGAGAKERVVDFVADLAAVDHRPAHALDRLLRTVPDGPLLVRIP